MTKTLNSSNITWKKTFFQIYIGQTFSLLSSSAVQFSIIWWITITTGSPIAITIASVVGLLPQAILGLYAFIIGFNIPFTAYVQKSIDDKHLGKVLSLIQVL